RQHLQIFPSCVPSSSRNLRICTVSMREKEYYEKKIATLKSFDEVDSIVASDSNIIEDIDDGEHLQQERAMRISNYSNVVLLILK
ncbi:hypothetical protein S83_063203, partial [Arachis hypogaea]